MRANKIIRIVTGTLLILTIPLLATILTDKVEWNWFDFLVIGILLIGTGLLYEFISTKLSGRYRSVVVIVLLSALFLAWAELSVGIIGSPFAGS